MPSAARPAARVFLIDGTAFCYRAFYGVRSLATADGRPTNAVFGFARMLQSLREKERPDYLGVAFDVGKPTFRHKQFDEYKIQRKPMPDPLIAQLPLVRQLLAAYRVPVFDREGFEAEDVLATITRAVAGPDVDVFLVTGDKDALQLVDAHVTVYNPHKKDDPILDAEAVRARYGVAPEQMVDLMALMGDEVDNIPGVPGVGEKTASVLIRRFGSLDSLYRRIDEVTPLGRRESLSRFRAQVDMARELARIRTDVPLSVGLEDLAPKEPDWAALRRLFRELEFKQLLAAVDEHAPRQPGAAIAVRVIDSAERIESWIAACRGKVSAVAGWPITAGSQREGSAAAIEGIMVAVAVEPGEAWVATLDHGSPGSEWGRKLAAWLADPRSPKIGHDLKLMMRWLDRFGLRLNGVAGDTMLAAYLLNPARTSQTLGDVANEHLDLTLPLLPKAGSGEREIVDPGPAPSAISAHAAAIVALQGPLDAKLESAGLAKLYREIELPLLTVLAGMERRGIALDVPYLQGLQATMSVRLAQLSDELFALAGCTFNLNSPKQLGQILFERLKLRIIKRTKTGPSTDSDVLQQLAADHPFPQKLLQYRELSKLVSTYVDALPKLLDAGTGRLHTSFNQAATSTGRLSSSEPNLQNIPIKTELGRLIRKAFIPGIPDGLLLAADYTQIELRILAHLSGDESLVQAFREDHDVHRYTASLIYGIPETEVQSGQRYAMKAVNYGILYGMSAHGLSKELGVPHPEAQEFIDAYFRRYPKVRAYLDRQIAAARRDGYVQTLLGRRRYIPEVNSPDPVMRQFGERMAVNAPIQGSAADLIKRAMVQVAEALADQLTASHLLLQVHDELIFEATQGELPVLARLVRRIMEQAIPLDVPVTVTLKAGPNWLDLKEFK
jgi:DNA polymerase-1